MSIPPRRTLSSELSILVRLSTSSRRTCQSPTAPRSNWGGSIKHLMAFGFQPRRRINTRRFGIILTLIPSFRIRFSILAISPKFKRSSESRPATSPAVTGKRLIVIPLPQSGCFRLLAFGVGVHHGGREPTRAGCFMIGALFRRVARYFGGGEPSGKTAGVNPAARTRTRTRLR